MEPAVASARIVIVGASGFVGGALARAMALRGTKLLCTARDAPHARSQADWPQSATQWIDADFAQLPDMHFWLRHLRAGDIVVNAAGVLREQRPGGFDAVHRRGPAALFEACARAGVAFVLQVSALGSNDAARSSYHRSKKAGDDLLRACMVPCAIVQPSLIWGEKGASAAYFAALAVSPVLPLPARGRQALQPVHIEDVVEGLAALIELQPSGCPTIAFTGPHAMTLRCYLLTLRRQLGLRQRPWMPSLPPSLFMAGATLASLLRTSFLDPETAGMLLRGNAAPHEDLARLLPGPARSVEAFLPPGSAEAMRRRAAFAWLLPILRLAIASVWLWTAAVSAGLYPRDQSLALLERVGAGGLWAEMLLEAAAACDAFLGLATLFASACLRARWLWPLQLGLIGFYTATISVAMPEFWLHPFGPLSKNLPMCAGIALLWVVDSGACRGPRTGGA